MAKKRTKKAVTSARRKSRGAGARKKAARATARKSSRRSVPARSTARKKRAAAGKTRRPARARSAAAGKGARPARAKAPAAGKAAAPPRRAPSLDRERRRWRDLDEPVPSPPSSLTLERTASAARSGRRELREAILEHTETGPALTGGDIDANWEDAYHAGEEAPGGDNPTPDQDRVDDIGKALGVQYQDNEELRSADKVADRDRHRWELDPASSEDYRDRD